MDPPNPSAVEEVSKSDRDQLENKLLAIMARLGLGRVTLESLGKLNPPDVYEKEMELMAEAKAYFHISYKVSYNTLYLIRRITDATVGHDLQRLK